MKNILVKATLLIAIAYSNRSAIASPIDSLYSIVYSSNDFEQIKDIIPVYETNARDEQLGKLYFLLGYKYLQVENLGKSFEYYLKSLKLYKREGDLVKEEKCLENLGSLALKLHQYKKANIYYYQAYEINIKLGDKKGIALSLKDIGVTLSKSEETIREAIWYHTQSADLFLQAEEYEWLSKAYLEVGALNRELELYGSAMDCYKMALKYSPESDEILAKVLNAQSNVLLLNGDYQQALVKQDSAIMIKSRLGNDFLLISSLNNLGVIHYKMGNYKIAYSALFEAFTINSNQDGLRQHNYENLHESYRYLDTVTMVLGQETRLVHDGVTKEFIYNEEKFVSNLEAYRIRDFIHQGELISEKDELIASLESRDRTLWILVVLLFLFFCIIVLITRQKIILIRRINKMVRDMDHKREVVLETLRRQGITLF